VEKTPEASAATFANVCHFLSPARRSESSTCVLGIVDWPASVTSLPYGTIFGVALTVTLPEKSTTTTPG
jgi:hypothetical protein